MLVKMSALLMSSNHSDDSGSEPISLRWRAWFDATTGRLYRVEEKVLRVKDWSTHLQCQQTDWRNGDDQQLVIEPNRYFTSATLSHSRHTTSVQL